MGLQMRRKRELKYESRSICVLIERMHDSKQMLKRRVLRKMPVFVAHADCVAALDLLFDVTRARGILPNLNNNELGI